MIYLPRAFAESDRAALHELIESSGFATLISPDADDHCRSARGASGIDRARARGNPHWRKLKEEARGVPPRPHAYVSPSWYGVHPSVPTWNYAVVHARGRARLIEDPPALEAIVLRLVATFENPRPVPWRMELPEDYQQGMIGGIVGFEIEISQLTGKFKLSQNRTTEDRVRVVNALEAGAPHEQEVAALMRKRVLREP
jgi:transcriptional regulator